MNQQAAPIPCCSDSPTGDLHGLRILMVIPGNEADALCMPFVRRQFDSLRRYGLNVQPFYLESRTSPTALVQAYRRLQAALREFDPHVLHAQFGTVTALFTCLASNGRPFVVTCRGSDLNPSPNDSWFRNRLGQAMTQVAALCARRIICVSEPLRRRLWWKSSSATVIPNGINLAAFALIPQQEARRKLGWDPDLPVALFNCRNDPVGKRLDLAEGAVAEARKQLPQLRLEVLRGKTSPTEIPWYLNAADCLLMTSDFEGSPNIVKEAIACNLPVVSVEVGDTIERLDGVTPSIVVPRDPVQLGLAIIAVLAEGRRSNGREIITRTIDECIVAERIAEVYREAVGITVREIPARRCAA